MHNFIAGNDYSYLNDYELPVQSGADCGKKEAECNVSASNIGTDGNEKEAEYNVYSDAISIEFDTKK